MALPPVPVEWNLRIVGFESEIHGSGVKCSSLDQSISCGPWDMGLGHAFEGRGGVWGNVMWAVGCGMWCATPNM